MPEIKHQFTGGKMDKDLDERLVQNGKYRDAMNIQVATSEGSDVATAQNILGNIRVGNITFDSDATVVASLADEKVDTLYWFVTTPTADYILSYVRNALAAEFVFVDTAKDVLKFNSRTIITGINIIDGMIFWTDATTEPKKINVERCKQGTSSNGLAQTLLINEAAGIIFSDNIKAEEKHITVIKRTPPRTMGVELVGIRDAEKKYTGVLNVEIDDNAANTSDLGVPNQLDVYNFSASSVGDTIRINVDEYVDNFGIVTALPPYDPTTMTGGINGFDGWETNGVIEVGTKLVLKQFDGPGNPPAIPITDYTIKCEIVEYDSVNYPGQIFDPSNGFYITLRITSINGYPPIPDGSIGQVELQYAIDLFNEEDKLFEFKFPRFSYRYKFEDGEYSSFAPFTQVAFLPGAFDYHPRKGYNLGMTNTLQSVKLTRFIDINTPADVVSVDILFKDEPSPVIYVVDTVSANDSTSSGLNSWTKLLNGDGFEIEKETVNSVVPSNQLLRPWDNVPRTALAQDITGNRIVYANYLQGYDLSTSDNRKYSANFNTNWVEFPVGLTEAARSCKTLREYQLGVVFTDQYGRETPVISNHTGTMKLEKDYASRKNRIQVSLAGGPTKRPGNVSNMKFFVKETSNEYYNMAMDRWYLAEDGNVWLSFPSSDRNKLDIDTFLILKKGSDQDLLVKAAARYKVLAIEAEAPDFVKTIPQLHSQVKHYVGAAVGGGTGNLFGSNTSGAPLQGENEFKINYEPYFETPGKLLHEYNEGDLYIEFGHVNEDEVSKRYRVSSITCTHDSSNPDTVTPDDEDVYNISIEEAFGPDVNFITDSPSGLSPTQIIDGTIVSFYKYKPRNLPQFDGRFFVKIYMDDTFRANIEKSYDTGLKYRIDNQEMLYYMREDWFEQFTQHMGWWFTPGSVRNQLDGRGKRGYSTPYGYQNQNDNNFDDILQLADQGPILSYKNESESSTGLFGTGGIWYTLLFPPSFIWADVLINKGMTGLASYLDRKRYGHYENDKYCASALFFRRYKMNTPNNENLRWKPCYWKPINSSVDKSLQQNWEKVGYLESEERAGIGSHFYFFNHYINENAWDGIVDIFTDRSGERYHGIVENSLPRDGSPWDKFIDVSIDAETWFIDSGRAQGRANSIDLKFNQTSITSNYTSCNKNGPAGGPNGLHNATGDVSWDMDIGFGGIFGAQGNTDTTAAAGWDATGKSFFGVGGWQGESLNQYTDGLQQMVSNLNPGEKFRFKEDPFKTIYTFSPFIEVKNYLNHSVISGDHGEGYLSKSKNHSRMPLNMEPSIPHNFRRTWENSQITPAIKWNPFGNQGAIPNGIEMRLECCNAQGSISSATSVTTGGETPNGEDVVIFVTDIFGTNFNNSCAVTDFALHEGMALKSYVRNDNDAVTTISTVTGGGYDSSSYIHSGNDFLAIRKIIPYYDDLGTVATPTNVITHYGLVLGGYNFPMQDLEHSWIQGLSNANFPKVGSNYTFVQVTANGHNANTEFNINNCGFDLSDVQQLNGQRMGKITAVGARLQLISEIQPLEVLSENPAIWETEPKESKELDIYYEASGAIPITVSPNNIQDAIPIGSIIRLSSTLQSNTSPISREVIEYDGMNIVLDGNVAININNGTTFTVIRPDGLEYSIVFTVRVAPAPGITSIITDRPLFPSNLYNAQFKLAWHNCYSFGNGVESNRIRDNYNLPFISNGVKVSTTLENEYKEEHRKYGLIYSGIYNSVAGVNSLNQFIAAEKITKDVNPIYGSIQKLHARDSDLVALCEDKCLRILANKDALFNANGNTNLTATERVLGQTIPFKGEYGISTNPESFASEAYRAYFADRIRGTVMRLSMDGLTPISDAGMHDWFRDNLKLVYQGKIIGSYDDRNEEYNIKLETYPDGNPFDDEDDVDDGDNGTDCSQYPGDLVYDEERQTCCGKCDEWIAGDPTHPCYNFCVDWQDCCCDYDCNIQVIGEPNSYAPGIMAVDTVVWSPLQVYNYQDQVEWNGDYYWLDQDTSYGQPPGSMYPIETKWVKCCEVFYPVVPCGYDADSWDQPLGDWVGGQPQSDLCCKWGNVYVSNASNTSSGNSDGSISVHLPSGYTMTDVDNGISSYNSLAGYFLPSGPNHYSPWFIWRDSNNNLIHYEGMTFIGLTPDMAGLFVSTINNLPAGTYTVETFNCNNNSIPGASNIAISEPTGVNPESRYLGCTDIGCRKTLTITIT